ncbi:MAG: DegT/DnrJ/EryC1/StrS family aminotransferase [Thermoproteales archaeon]|nr:DegT/DnrJ/EryC1/StrS family aminotransferase [Thermoproteales archaeon]
MVEKMSNLAVKGGSPLRTKPWPKWPIFDEREKRNLIEVLESGLWGIGGSKNEEFAKKFAEYQGAKYGVTCVNGTIALEIALRALGIGYGDEVITTPYTFIATAQSIIYVNAKPVFVDIEEDTYNIDPKKIEEAITDKTKAIMPVHIGGAPANMDEIMKIAKKYDLYVIEDAAQAHGAKWGDKGVGSIGDFGTFSFQSSKNITSGEGGIIITNSEDLAEKAWSYMNCGRVRKGLWYRHVILGANYRMSEFLAAILLAQLERADELFKKRERNAEYLAKRLREIEGVEPLNYPEKARSAYHLFIFKYRKYYFENLPREKFIEALNAEGIPVSPGYTIPLYKMPAIQEYNFPGFGKLGKMYDGLSLPVTEKACKEEALWLKQTIFLAEKEDMDDIADAIIKIKRNIKELL